MSKVKEVDLSSATPGTGTMVGSEDAKLEVGDLGADHNDAAVNGDNGIDLSPTGIAAKLLHTLDVYPQISSSMLQIAMNPLKAGDWRPTLEYLIRVGRIHRLHLSAVSPAGRSITYTLIRAVDPHGVLNAITERVLAQSAEAMTSASHDEADAYDTADAATKDETTADPLED